MPHYKLKEKVTFTCINCGEIKTLYYNPNQSFKYCSRKCYLEIKAKETVLTTCKYCGKEKKS